MKLLIIDGHSILNRAFFGIRSLNAPDGTPTNAVYGYINILTRLISEYKPDAVCSAFDLKSPTFRHKACEFYKAQRKPMPEELSVQVPVVKELLTKMGIKYYETEGYEADDILGTAGRICADKGWECIIATGDRDSLQLVDDKVSVALVKNSETVLYDPSKFRTEYGFEPCAIVDLKSLMGDSSDNIPGVPGVGEKTAMGLIQTYGTLDGVYNHLEELKDSVKNKLAAGEESARTSYWLATIFKEVPLDFSPEDNIWDKDYTDGLFDYLKKLGFHKFIQSWNVSKTDAAAVTDTTGGELLPEGMIVTDNLKKYYLDNGFEEVSAFDTTLAGYLINPTAKEYYPEPYSVLNSRLKELGLSELYYKTEIPLCRVLAKMEKKGFLVDKDALYEFGENIRTDALEERIYGLAGTEFNINSPKQLSEVLFDRLMLPTDKKRSTNAEVLEKLRPLSPIIDDILEYRMLAKLKSTYCDGLLKVIADDGRIHTNFQNTVTATGRLSSTEPNLQNIPIRKELGSQIRKMFIASPGNVLIDADYSQIELRLLAHIADDRAMIDAFNSGEDFHRVTASKVFGVPIEEVTPRMRSSAKAVNFGIVYGISAFSLAQDIGVTNSEAKQYMDAYFAKFSSVAEYMADIKEKAKRDGYVTTLYGRRRDLPELKSSNFMQRQFGERVALNMPIQGTAADIIKMAMVEADRRIDGMVLQVHDELIVECPEDRQEETASVLKECMQNVASLSVPLVVDVGTGHSWAEAH